MDIAAYVAESAVERDHWWFVGRRWLFSKEIKHLKLDTRAAVLDVGTGTGANLRMLRDKGFTNITGVDTSDEAIRFCAQKGFGCVRKGDIAALPFPAHTFDLVLATDVIEHVDDDAAAVRELARMLKPDGRLLLTAPAFPALWGLQDRVSHHRRRYRMRSLCTMIQEEGLAVVRNYHFNFLLFAPIFAARQLLKFTGAEKRLRSELQINSPALNAILTPLFILDARTAPWLRPPFGVSILLVATPLDRNRAGRPQ